MGNSYNALEYNKLISFIWSVADDCLRDVYVRGKYRDVIVPMTIIRRFDAIIEPHKSKILEYKKMAEDNKLDIEETLNTMVELPFYNTSNFNLKDLRHETNRQNLKKNFEEYLNGFSDNIKEILEKFDFSSQLRKMTNAGILGSVIEKFTSKEMNLSPYDEENNEEAGEHFTPRDAVELVADLAIVPVLDKMKNGTYSIYDGACGTLGMATVAEEKLQKHAEENNKQLSIHIFGQESTEETYAIAKADLLIKGGNTSNGEVYYGSTLSNDGARGKHFDFMLSNPPYGKTWKNDLSILGAGIDKDLKKNVTDSRFVRSYKEQDDYRMIPDVSDGQLLFLLNNISKMKDTPLGSRIVEVHNGSALFTGDAGGGASNARRYMIEEDLIEAIIQLPENMFYNTGITTYIWVLSNRKEERRKGKIQLIDASNIKTPLKKNLGLKNCEFSNEDRKLILDILQNFEENDNSKIFSNEDFGYYKVTVERPLRQAVLSNNENIFQVEKELEKIGFYTGEITKEKLTDSFIKNTVGAIKELEKKENIQSYLKVLKELKSEEVCLDYAKFEKEFDKKLKEIGIKGITFKKLVSTGLLENIIVKDDKAVIQKDKQGNILVDTELRDTEIIPLTYPGGIEEFIKEEVLPYHDDAFVDESKTQIGYEINFTKYFYKPKQLESVETIVARIRELEKLSEGMMKEILEGFND